MEVSKFINIGNSYRPRNQIGWDVIFECEINGTRRDCFIECKLWGRPVGLPSIFKYYERACKKGHPISILVASDLQKSLESESVLQGKEPIDNEELEDLKEVTESIDIAQKELIEDDFKFDGPKEEEFKIEEQEMGVSVSEKVGQASAGKMAKIRKDYVKLINDLGDQHKINIYTVKFDPETGKFDSKALKEYQEPSAVFIVTNSTFNPPLLSAKS